MKIVGINADNYKQAKFEEELKKDGFTNYIVEPFHSDTCLIKVTIPEADFGRLALVVQRVTRYFDVAKRN